MFEKAPLLQSFVPHGGQTHDSASEKFLQKEKEKFLENALVMAFGEVLRTLRLEAGLSQEQLSFRSEIQRKHISALENGRKEPSITTLFRLATALGTPPDKFVSLVMIALEQASKG
jgi:DNA-binding XRE family transcriptional regulator